MHEGTYVVRANLAAENCVHLDHCGGSIGKVYEGVEGRAVAAEVLGSEVVDV